MLPLSPPSPGAAPNTPGTSGPGERQRPLPEPPGPHGLPATGSVAEERFPEELPRPPWSPGEGHPGDGHAGDGHRSDGHWGDGPRGGQSLGGGYTVAGAPLYPQPTPNLPFFPKPDLRDTWVGTERAAELYGVGRTQMWRLGKKWAAMMALHEIPPVLVMVLGTEDIYNRYGQLVAAGRPAYKFHLPTLQQAAAARRDKKNHHRQRKSRQAFRALLDLLDEEKIQKELQRRWSRSSDPPAV
jgi:hypothetical protein